MSKRKARKRAPAAAPQTPRKGNPRGDGFVNTFSGLGVAGQDRRLATTYHLGFELALAPQIIRSLMRGDPIANKIVSKQVQMALAGGINWRASSPAGEDLKPQLNNELKRLNAINLIKSARIWGRAFGQALLIMNVDDGGSPQDPLNLERLNRITHLRRVYKPKIMRIELDTSGGDRDGLPEFYTVQSASGAALRVHYTRVIQFSGLEVDDETFERLSYSHDTVLQPVWETLRDHQAGGATLASLLEDSVKVVWKIQGLHDAIAAGDSTFVSNWMQSMQMFTSAFRSIGLDSESEDIQHLSKPLKDSVDTYLALMHRLAAAADMPMSELFGTAPSGLSTDDQAGARRYYDKIRSEEQQGALKTALDRLIEVMIAQRSSPLFEASIDYEWPSLWSPTAKETAELNKLNADTHAVMVAMGAWGPDIAAAALAPSLGVELPQVEASEGELEDERGDEDLGAKTPAKPSERISGSRVNPEGSASGKRGGIELTAEIERALERKASEHNEKYGEDPARRLDVGALKAVYRRGAGAFSSTHRPGMSRNQWAMGRVNAFIELVRRGRPANPAYTTDNDLLPPEHERAPGE
jgi:phage-related protein (TIGR01555 family)